MYSELTRAKCNKLQSLPQQIMMIANNLPSGYFRDLQIIKEVFLPAFQELKDCLQMTTYIMNEIKVNEHILDDDKYLFIFSVEEVNRLAREGMPFRDAYKKVGLDIEAGKFTHNKQVHHTHEGSIGNLCNDAISALMQQVVDGFNFLWNGRSRESIVGTINIFCQTFCVKVWQKQVNSLSLHPLKKRGNSSVGRA